MYIWNKYPSIGQFITITIQYFDEKSTEKAKTKQNISHHKK